MTTKITGEQVDQICATNRASWLSDMEETLDSLNTSIRFKDLIVLQVQLAGLGGHSSRALLRLLAPPMLAAFTLGYQIGCAAKEIEQLETLHAG